MKYVPHFLVVVLAFLLASSLDYSAELEREIAGLQSGLANTPDREQVSMACHTYELEDGAQVAENSPR